MKTQHVSVASPTALFLLAFVLPLSFLGAQLDWPCVVVLNASLLLAVVILLKPVVGLHLLIFLIPVGGNVFYAAMTGDWNLKEMDTFSVSAPLVLVSFAGAILQRWGKIQAHSPLNPLMPPIFILILYAGTTALWSDNVAHSLFQFFVLTSNAMLFCLIVFLVRDADTLKKALWLWVLSMGCQSVLAMASFFLDSTTGSKEVLPFLKIGMNFTGGLLDSKSSLPRSAAGLQEQHETSLLMNMTFSVIVGLLMTNGQKRFRQCVLIGLLFLNGLVTLKTDSRAGFGALLVAVPALFFLIDRLRQHLAKMLLIFFLSMLGLYLVQHVAFSMLVDEEFTPRVFSLGMKAFESSDVIDAGIPEKDSRKRLWSNSFAEYLSMPLEGFGIGNLKVKMDAVHAHSIYFSLILDFGMIGLFFLAWVAVWLTLRLARQLRRQDSPAQILAACMTGGVIVLSIQGLVDFEYNLSTMWAYLALTTAALEIAQAERQRRTSLPGSLASLPAP